MFAGIIKIIYHLNLNQENVPVQIIPENPHHWENGLFEFYPIYIYIKRSMQTKKASTTQRGFSSDFFLQCVVLVRSLFFKKM